MTLPSLSFCYALPFARPRRWGANQLSPRTRSRFGKRCAPPARATFASAGDLPLSMDVEAFLRDSWGRLPAFLPSLLPEYSPPLSPDDLAGLATDPAVESRIITGRGCGQPGDQPYTLTLGPFSDDTFASPLCADGSPWTLLVQEVNFHVPAVAELLDSFRLVPNWRVDDVMVSYATTSGGVGPHVDNYDVFLLQVSGTRRWRTRDRPMSASEERAALIPNCDVRVLSGGFQADTDRVLSPGDCMYVPPRCPHWGEALSDDCMTFSIGFRAPRLSDLAVGWVEEISRRQQLADCFLSDVTSELSERGKDPGRITDSAIDAAYAAIRSAFVDSAEAKIAFRDWFCEQVTAPKRHREASHDDEAHAGEMEEESARHLVTQLLRESEAFREVFIRQQDGSVFGYSVLAPTGPTTNSVMVANMYVDGYVVCACNVSLAALICSKRVTPSEEYSGFYNQCCARDAAEMESVLTDMFFRDLLYIEEDEELAIAQESLDGAESIRS